MPNLIPNSAYIVFSYSSASDPTVEVIGKIIINNLNDKNYILFKNGNTWYLTIDSCQMDKIEILDNPEFKFHICMSSHMYDPKSLYASHSIYKILRKDYGLLIETCFAEEYLNLANDFLINKVKFPLVLDIKFNSNALGVNILL